ncbi:MAG: hypothetical protein K2I35_02775, partial [Duncaniella sp.]|nr:hypothetical protein [Duncaniella sp.]
MRLFLRLILLTLLCSVTTSVYAQIVTTTPVTVTKNSSDIVITLHADGGNKGLMGTPSTTPIYAHTGVITNKSTSSSDWKHATDWNTLLDKHKMTYVSANTWTLTIPDIRTFYGITDPTESVEKLCFVFHTKAGKEAKTAAGGDIFVPIYPDNFPSASTQATYPGGIPRMGTTLNADGSVTFCLGAPSKSTALPGAYTHLTLP